MGQSPNSASYNDSGDGIPFFQGNADFGERYPITRVWCSSPTKTANAGDILISVRAPIGAVNYATEKCCIGRGLAAITPDSRKASPEYIYWLLKWKSKELNTKGTGSTFKAINREILENILVPDIPLKKQILYAGALEKNYRIIQQHRKQLSALDDLIKARFVEMFGDPILNTQNRPTTDFVNVVTMQRGFDLPVQERHQNGKIKVYGANGPLDHHNTPKVFGGGIITGRSGTIGNVYYTLDDYWPLNTTLFSVDMHGNNVIYLAYLLQLYNLSRFVEGTGVPTLNRNKFHSQQIINVPSSEQIKFADFVKQINIVKSAIQNNLSMHQLLFDNLMQKYFG